MSITGFVMHSIFLIQRGSTIQVLLYAYLYIYIYIYLFICSKHQDKMQ